MNEPEAFQLLTLASARDGRTVTQAVAKVWASDLERVDIRDAVEGIQLHYRESDKWLMPSHVIAGARRVREARQRQERIATLRREIAGNVITLDRAKFEAETQAAIQKHRAERGTTT